MKGKQNALQGKTGIRLDIACGAHKQDPAFVGMDIQQFPGVDVVHDINIHPWPFEDESVLMAVASHIVEHIPPVAIGPNGTWFPFMEFMNEVWRILVPDGKLAIAAPHGMSAGYLQDPTHCNALNEGTWAYFDPLMMNGVLFRGYKPKPWKTEFISWDPSANIEVILVKRREDPSYYEPVPVTKA